jgi:hypothetical protein
MLAVNEVDATGSFTCRWLLPIWNAIELEPRKSPLATGRATFEVSRFSNALSHNAEATGASGNRSLQVNLRPVSGIGGWH